MDGTFIRKLKFYEGNRELWIHIADLAYCQNDIKEYCRWFSPYERLEANKFYPDYLRELYIKSHGILRYILASYINCDPATIEFGYSKYRKPFVKGSNIQFNMSHSGKMVGYAISFGRKVGIDIECHERNINVYELSDIVFTQGEQDHFSTLAPNQQIKFFYEAWTLKEAAIKANGQGMSYPIDTIDTLPILTEQEKFVFTKGEEDKLKQWYCNLLKINSACSGAVVIENQPIQPINVK